MPEYLAPGVFVEETSFRQKTLEGVSTSTTGFVGPTRFGPTNGEPSLLTSFAEFERIYCGLDQLEYNKNSVHNYLAHAVRGFFDEGGKRLYVARAFKNGNGDGIAQWPPDSSPAGFKLKARYPGSAGNFIVTFRFKLSENLLIITDSGERVLRGVRPYDVVMAGRNDSSPSDAEPYWIDRAIENGAATFRLHGAEDSVSSNDIGLDDVNEVRLLTVSVIIGRMGKFGEELAWENLGLDPRQKNSLARVFEKAPSKLATALYVPMTFSIDPEPSDGAKIAAALLDELNMDMSASPPRSQVWDEMRDFFRYSPPSSKFPSAAEISFQIQLKGGDDGDEPTADTYRGTEDEDASSGLKSFESLEDISIIAAPGSSRGNDAAKANGVHLELIKHCELMRYRVAVLDAGEGNQIAEVKQLRAKLDSTRAALYYPWVRVYDPITETEVMQPPSGYVSGIYARNDIEFGVHKSPANEVIRNALGFELLINKAQQEVLNPDGINCLRYFENRGFRVWGARTISSDPEWKYLNVRRYFAYLERSIEKGTQWAVFENNGDVLWAKVRSTIEDFLFNEWKENRLFGLKPKEAYFVRCDRTTMTQNDIDNGRLICLIGVAPLRPAEFVIFRIGQKTAEA